jgi:hypothetical protein
VKDWDIGVIPTDPPTRRKIDHRTAFCCLGQLFCRNRRLWPALTVCSPPRASAEFRCAGLPDFTFANCAPGYCSAAVAPQQVGDIGKKMNQINELDGYDAILTCSDSVSMVRAVFEGDGRNFHQLQHSFGSPQHG